MKIDSGPAKNTLEIGNHNGEVCLNHPQLDVDVNGVGHIIFSPSQARNLALLLHRHADIAEGGKQCVHCGCTEHTACVDQLGYPCGWLDLRLTERAVCSKESCVDAELQYRYKLRAEAAVAA